MLRSLGYLRNSVRRLGSTRPHALVGLRESSCLARKSASPGYGSQTTGAGRLPAVQRFDRRAFSQETRVSPFPKPTATGAFILRTRLALYTHLLKWVERADPDSEIVIATLKGLSSIQLKLGDVQATLSSLERALAIEIKFHGTENAPSILETLEALSGVHMMLGNKQEGTALVERLLAATIEVKGHDHPDVARLAREAARGRGFLRDHEGKKALLLKALERQRALFGRSYMEDLDYSRTLLFLASAHVMLGEVEDANRIVDSVIEVLHRREAPLANEANLGMHLLHCKAILEGELGRPADKALLLTDLLRLLNPPEDVNPNPTLDEMMQRQMRGMNTMQLKYELALAAAETNEPEKVHTFLQEIEKERTEAGLPEAAVFSLMASRVHALLGDKETKIRLLREASETATAYSMQGDMHVVHIKHAFARALRQRGDAEALAEAETVEEANKAGLAILEEDRLSALFVVDRMDRTRLAIMLELGGESF